MAFTDFPLETLKFFTKLTNNNKARFEAHRGDYDDHVMELSRNFVIAIGERLCELAPNITNPKFIHSGYGSDIS